MKMETLHLTCVRKDRYFQRAGVRWCTGTSAMVVAHSLLRGCGCLYPDVTPWGASPGDPHKCRVWSVLVVSIAQRTQPGSLSTQASSTATVSGGYFPLSELLPACDSFCSPTHHITQPSEHWRCCSDYSCTMARGRTQGIRCLPESALWTCGSQAGPGLSPGEELSPGQLAAPAQGRRAQSRVGIDARRG